VYELMPVTDWNKRATILIPGYETIEKIWKQYFKKKRLMVGVKSVKHFIAIQEQDFNHCTVKLERCRYMNEMTSVIAKLLPLLIKDKPGFFQKHLSIKQIKIPFKFKAVSMKGEKQNKIGYQYFYAIKLSEQLNSYIQMQELGAEDNKSLLAQEWHDFKEYLKHKFSETEMNRTLKIEEVEDLFEKCLEYLEEGEYK